MRSPQESRHFTRWVDPETGVVSWLLATRVAPLQQTFYYVNDGWTQDGRYLWFYCGYPPSAGKCLGVVDFQEDRVSVFPETQFLDASPAVDPATGEAYWTSDLGLYRRSPAVDGQVERINAFPEELAKGRSPRRLATHLTFSADGASVGFDAELGTDWMAGDFPLDGTPPRIWRRFDVCYNHGQFSPANPDLMLIAQDGWNHAATGQKHDYTHRMWLLSRDGACEPIYPQPTPLHGHEWWDPSSQKVWYINYGVGVECVDLKTRQHDLVWGGDISHAHASREGLRLVGDHFRKDGSGLAEVRFFDVASRKETAIVSAMPDLSTTRKLYHIHPHPRFCVGDRFVCYTSAVRNQIDVAVAEVGAGLI